MQKPSPNATTLALYVVGALLLANLIAMIFRTDSAIAQAQRQPPIAGGAGLFIMPAQLAGNQWGAYLMDIDKGTLSVYQFFPGTSQLKFVAARKFTNDTKMENWNTTPSPSEVADLVEKQNK